MDIQESLKQLLVERPRSFTYLLSSLNISQTQLYQNLKALGAVEDLGLWRLPAPALSPPAEPEELGLSQLLNRIKRLQDQNRLLRAQNQALASEVEALKRERELALVPVSDTSFIAGLDAEPFGASPVGVGLCIWSDWHWGERVADGSFSPQEASRRVVRLLSLLQKEWEKSQLSHRVSHLCLGLLGDFISGGIHDEAREIGGNHLTPTEEITQVQGALAWAIKTVLTSFRGLEKLTCICVHGNHGRLTKHSRATSGHRYNLETMMYWNLRQQFRGHKRVEFLIAEDTAVYTQVLGKTLRWCHGDFARAIDPPGLHKWMQKQNHQIRHADFTLMGHVHHLYCADGLITNGSLVGPTDYSKSLGYGEPAQQIFVCLDAHGVAQVSRLYVAN